MYIIPEGIPGQSFKKHLEKSCPPPTQSDPLYSGLGLSQTLVLNVTPKPQVVVHILQTPHSPQSPSTEITPCKYFKR